MHAPAVPPFTPSTSMMLLSQSSMLQSASAQKPHAHPQHPPPPFSLSQQSFSLTQGNLLSQSSRRSTSGSIFRRGSAAPKRPRSDSACSSGSDNEADSERQPQQSNYSLFPSIAVPAFKSARTLATKHTAAADLLNQPALQVEVDAASSHAPAALRSASKSVDAAASTSTALKPFETRVHHRQKIARTTPIDLTPPKLSSFIAISRSEEADASPASAVPLCVNWQPTAKAKRRLRREQQRVVVSSGFGRKRVSVPSAAGSSTVAMRVAEVLDDDIAMLEVEVTKQQQQESLIDLTEADALAEEAPSTEPPADASSPFKSDTDEIYWPQVDVHRAVPGVLKKRNLAPAKTFPVRRDPPRASSFPGKPRQHKPKVKAPSVRRMIEHDPDDDDWIVGDDAVDAEEAAIEAQSFDDDEEFATADPRAQIKQEFAIATPEPVDAAVAAVGNEQRQSESSTVDSSAPLLTQPPPKLKRLLRLSECIPTLPPMPAFLAVAVQEPSASASIEVAAEIGADDAGDAAGVAQEEVQAATESPAPAAELRLASTAAVRRGSSVLHRDANFPLPWINEFSDSPPPAYEHLTDANPESAEVAKISSVHHLFKGCSCAKGKCQATTCECRIRGSAGYSSGNVVRAQTVEGLNLWECGSECTCSSTCLNRVSQRFGTYNKSLPLYLFRHAEQQLGWGVKSQARIDRGQFIGQYMGKLKSESECCDESINDEYMFTVFPNALHSEDVHELEQLLESRQTMDEMLADWPRVTVDAYEAGNVTRFINHSCDPNVVSIQVYAEDRSPHRAKILYFARVPILPHKELTIDYHYERNPRSGGEWPFVCNCGTVQCQHPTARKRNELEKQKIDDFFENEEGEVEE